MAPYGEPARYTHGPPVTHMDRPLHARAARYTRGPAWQRAHAHPLHAPLRPKDVVCDARAVLALADHGGCRHAAYTCICACGPNSAVLHYGHAGAPNERHLEPSDMALLDMGCEYNCYASDITCSFPVCGTFTPDQTIIYEAVLDAQKQILAAMRPGVGWSDMHLLMHTVVLTHLRDAGLLVGDVGEMMEVQLGAVFTPHGLGHLIGIDTHDVRRRRCSQMPSLRAALCPHTTCTCIRARGLRCAVFHG